MIYILESDYSSEKLEDLKKYCKNINFTDFDISIQNILIVFKDETWFENFSYKKCPVWNKEKDYIEEKNKESIYIIKSELNSEKLQREIEKLIWKKVEIEVSNKKIIEKKEKKSKNSLILKNNEKMLFVALDKKKKWIKNFIEASSNKQEIIDELISKAVTFNNTEDDCRAKLGDVDTVIPYLVNDSNLKVILEEYYAEETFKNYILLKYPQQEKYIKYLFAYQDENILDPVLMKFRTKILELCQNSKLYLPPEFDTDSMPLALKGKILINGAENLINSLVTNLNCSKSEAIKLIQEGKDDLDKILEDKIKTTEGGCPLKNPNWISFKWWQNYKDSAEWTKDRVYSLQNGKEIPFRWIDLIDEIEPDCIHNEKESPSVVIERFFKEKENKYKKLCRKYEELNKLYGSSITDE